MINKDKIMMMDIRKLEKERINKINNLSLDEVKAYIEHINRKQWEGFEENNQDKVRFYGDKLKEVFEITSDKWDNLDFYSLGVKFRISNARMIMKNTLGHIHNFSFMSQLVINAEMRLMNYISILRHILLLYYGNHTPRDLSLVEDLILNLEFKHDFKDKAFDDYARGNCQESDDILMDGLDSILKIIKADIMDIIEAISPYIKRQDDFDFEELSESIRQEKDYVIKMAESDDGVRVLYDEDYLDLLIQLLEVSKIFDESCKSFIKSRDKVLDFINSDDGFLDFKLYDYDFYCKSFPNVPCDKESYMAVRPKYNMRECRFIPSGHVISESDDRDESP